MGTAVGQNIDNEPGAAIAEFADELAQIADEVSPGQPGEPLHQNERAVGPAVINLDLVMQIPVVMKVVLGSASMPVSTLSRMKRGAIVTLDRRSGDPADIVVNGRTLARGKIVVVDEATGQLGISITEIVPQRPAVN